jgi:RNA polymerase sigma-70 factor (ECF subfamily)
MQQMATMVASRDFDDRLARSAGGDPQAFASLVRDHQSMVFSIACHFLRDPALAEEMAQEVFLHLYRNLAAIDSPAHLLHWLRRVTTHRCIDHARRARLRPKVGLEQAPEPRIPHGGNDPMLADRLRRLVDGLPERARAIVVLRYQEDLEPAEIAAMLNIPVGTVKSCLHRALALLRGKLERAGRGVRR